LCRKFIIREMIMLTIHVVRPGDSIFQLAQIYGVSQQAIINSNRLDGIPYLVQGQALVIPTTEQAYRVMPGDSVWSIAQRFGVSVNAIVRLNNIADPSLIQPGMVIRIPQYSQNYGTIEVNAFIEPSTAEREREIVNEAGPFLTYISPFSYQVNYDGTLTAIRDETIISTAREHNVASLLVITNFREGNFDADLAHTILVNESLQQTLIDNVIQAMRAKGYYGLNIDFERIPPEDRQLYNDFLRRVVARLRPLNYPVSTALAPKPEDYQTGAWHGAHDYQAHGQIVDFVILMTYEWGWSGGPPYAVAPIDLVEDVIRYAVSVIPPDKILMGMPTYGYDWPLPYMPGGGWARRVSPQEAIRIAAQRGAVINYNTQVQAPYFNYYDDQGIQHIIWFEDARSVRAKLLLVNRYGLRGVSYWVLGVPFPQNWEVLNDMFRIVKVV
jgi:spore germination protein